MTDKPTQEHIPEILNNGIIGLQDRLDTLDETLKDRLDTLDETLNDRLRTISEHLENLNNILGTIGGSAWEAESSLRNIFHHLADISKNTERKKASQVS